MINVQGLDFKSLTRTRRVNGERTIELDIYPTSKNIAYFDLVVEEAILSFDGDEYVIKKLNEKSIGKTYWKQVTAIHKFYVDLINKQQPRIHNGSITFQNYMNMVFEGTPYANFEVVDQFLARSFENLGNDNRVALMQKGLDRFKAELELVGSGYKPRFKQMIGEDTDTQFRYGHNVKGVDRGTDTTNLATKISGTGDPELGIKASYTSPNVAIFGEIEAPPVDDGRFKSEEALLEEMKARLQDEPEVTITVDFVDLRAAGYPYHVPNEGDRIWLIYEPMDDLLIETRILEIKERFDTNLRPIETETTLSNHKKTFAGTMFDNIQKQLSQIVNDDGVVKYDVLDEAVKIATEALHSAQTQLIFDNGIIARDKNNPNKMVVYNSAGLGISDNGGNTFRTAITGDGIVADVITSGTLRAIDIIGTNIMSFNPVTNDIITLENGIIETFEDGDKTFEVNAKGLSAFSRSTGETVGTFRSAVITGDSTRRGLDIMGWSDYLSISKHLGDGNSRTMLGFYWDEDYDRTVLYGGSGERDSGQLLLRSTQSGGSAGSRVPHLVIDNRTVDGTAYSGARFYVGRDNRSPSSANFRSGFEVWQYTGNGNGGMHRFIEMDTNTSGDRFVDFWVDEFYVGGHLSIGGASDFYGHLNMNNWNITNVGDIAISRIRVNQASGRFIQFFNNTITTNDSSYDGVSINRVNGYGGVFFHTNRGMLTGGTSSNFSVLVAGSDSTSGFIQSTNIRDRPYSFSSNVYVTGNGILGNVSSARRYKTLIEPMKVDHYKILDIIPSDWYDKFGTEAFAHYLSNKNTMNLDEEDIPFLRRIPGAVAEDFVDVGLDIYVTYNNDGDVQSLMYDRAWLSLVPITNDHEDRLNEYDNRFGTIENRLDKLEKEMDKLRGVA